MRNRINTTQYTRSICTDTTSQTTDLTQFYTEEK